MGLEQPMRTIDIFEVKTINQLAVLKAVYENDGSVNIDKISKKTSLDYKTVNLIWEDMLGIIENNQILNQMDDYWAARIKIIEASWVYHLCEKLLLGKDVPIISFTMDHYLSESKLRRKITHINELLSSTDLKIVSRKGSLYIRGKEVQARFLANQFFWTIFKGIKWPFKEVDFASIALFFKEEVFNGIDLQIKDSGQVEWCYIFAINFIRFNQGRTVTLQELPDFTKDYLSFFTSKKIHKTDDILSSKYLLSESERMYFFLCLQTRPDFYLMELFYNQSIASHKANQTDIFKVLQWFMNYLGEKNKYFEDNRLVASVLLSATMKAAMVNGFYRTTTGYAMTDFFQKRAPKLLPTMEKIIDTLSEEYPTIYFLKEKKYLATKFAEAYSLAGNMMDFEKKIVVGVVTDLSITLEELLVRKLQAIFYLVDNIQFITLGHQDVSYFDLVIKTTVTLGDMAKKGERVVVINPDIEQKDIAQIKNVIVDIKRNMA